MESQQRSRIGAILFFLGLIFLLVSWYYTYPIHMVNKVDELIFTQFFPLIWPGIFFSLIGLFLTGYYSTRKSIKAICASLFPIILYSYVFFYSYIPSSDSGYVKSMFEVFHLVGIDSSIVSYFQYPTYFTLNEITSQISGVYANGIATIFFALYGILLGLYLYIFLLKSTKNNTSQIALLAGFLYFTVSFSFINYQWVPQTLAFVFFFLLLITFNYKGLEYKIISLILFAALIFTHAFFPVIFLLFFGFYIMKNREHFKMFLLMNCLYLAILIYYSSHFFPQIIDAFRETIYGFREYSSAISKSFKETTGVVDQFISLINRIRIPLTLALVIVGFVLDLIKKKISYILIALTIAGGFYFTLGIMYSVLGFRALQFVVASFVVGIGFFIVKWKKATVVFVLIIVMLSVFGPIRANYDLYQYHSSEETKTCDFLAQTLPINQSKIIFVSDEVNYGYFKNIESYINKTTKGYITAQNIVFILTTHEQIYSFLTNFNETVGNLWILYNPNLEKELFSYGITPNELQRINENNLLTNKVYQCDKTYIITEQK